MFYASSNLKGGPPVAKYGKIIKSRPIKYLSMLGFGESNKFIISRVDNKVSQYFVHYIKIIASCCKSYATAEKVIA